jgi:hypothetical protein
MLRRVKDRLFPAACVACAALGLALPVAAETLASDRRISVVLEDGTNVVLYGAAGRPRNGKIDYYYLPPALRLTTNQAGKPEFLFMKISNDDRDGLSGALLHFLVGWGLRDDQEEELTNLVEGDFNGRLAGAATLFPSDAAGPGFSIISGTLNDAGTEAQLITSGQASLMPGGKAAAATRLNGDGAQILAQTFDEDAAITDITAAMNMEYAVQVQGVEGTVSIEWSRIEEQSETIFADYSRTLDEDARQENRCFIVWCNTVDVADYVYDYEEVREQFDFLEENEFVRFEFVQGDIPVEVAAPIRDAFIQYFISSVTQVTRPEIERAEEDDSQTEDELANVRQGAGYTFDATRVREATARGTQQLQLDMKLTVRYPLTLVGNMKDWYGSASAFPDNVFDIRLDDPFYDFRDVVFLLDGDVEDMFAQHINAVTVEIRKTRPGNDFLDSFLFTNQTLAETGNLGRVTYSRGSDNGSELYDYRVKWDLRGGLEYIDPPSGWATGSWEGLTLAAPIEARTIELETDLDEMTDAGVTRVTAQIRYPVLGVEKEENIQLSVTRDNPIVEKEIFLDREAQGYVVRLVYHHRRLGRLATPWSVRGTDDYIFASVPEEWFDPLVAADADDPVVIEAQDAVDAETGDQLSQFDILTEDN